MVRILLGYLSYGRTNGISRYLLNTLNLLEQANVEPEIVSIYLDEDLKQELIESGIRVHEVCGVKHPLKQLDAMKAIFASQHYDIAYFNISEAFNCMGIIAAHRAGVEKIIVHSHNSGINEPDGLKRWIRHLAHTWGRSCIMKQDGTDFYACSLKAGEWMFPESITSSDRFHIIFNAVDLKQFGFDPSLRKTVRSDMHAEERHVIGCVGAFSYQKNPLFMLDLAEELKQNDPEAVIWMIGDGELRKPFLEQAAQRGLQKMIYAPGVRNDVPALMMAMDCLVMPSRFEGLPYAAVEAQAANLPVVLSDTISKEASLRDRCRFLSLQAPKREWSDAIRELIQLPRTTDAVDDSRFDVGRQQNELLKLILENTK